MSINKVILIGNAGADAEVKFMQSGEPVSNLSIGTSRKWKDKQTGQDKSVTEWHRLVAYNIGNFKLAEYLGQVRKGEKVYIEGRLQTRKWQDKEGKDQYTTEIIVEQIENCNGKRDSQDLSPQQQQYQQPVQQPFNPQVPPPPQFMQPPPAQQQQWNQQPIQPPAQQQYAGTPVFQQQQPAQGYAPVPGAGYDNDVPFN